MLERWPAFHLDEWLPTYETLHRWTQIVGKTRLGLAPFQNHWWHSSFYVTPRGLTTGVMPYSDGMVEVSFDFLDDALDARTSNGEVRRLRLENMSVAAFYKEYRAMLRELGVTVRIAGSPNEMPDATRFADDTRHASYDGGAVRRWFAATLEADRAMKRFRSGFAGKCSPCHFWWGGFDLACTRFSGRRAPPYSTVIPNTPAYVMTEAYSHECISAGWWPGSAGTPVTEAAFYAYVYPEPPGCALAPIGPMDAFWHTEMHEWILPYAAVRVSNDPAGLIARFLESTYQSAANLAGWDVNALRATPPTHGTG